MYDVEMIGPFKDFMCDQCDMSRKHQPGKFSSEEDKALVRLVEAEKKIKWPKIAKKLGTKTARQCRDRYQNYLDPCLNHEEWTVSEDSLLLSLYSSYGAKWTRISKEIEGRSMNSVRNRWQCLSRQSYTTNNTCKTFVEVKDTEDGRRSTSRLITDDIEAVLDEIFRDEMFDDTTLWTLNDK